MYHAGLPQLDDTPLIIFRATSSAQHSILRATFHLSCHFNIFRATFHLPHHIPSLEVSCHFQQYSSAPHSIFRVTFNLLLCQFQSSVSFSIFRFIFNVLCGCLAHHLPEAACALQVTQTVGMVGFDEGEALGDALLAQLVGGRRAGLHEIDDEAFGDVLSSTPVEGDQIVHLSKSSAFSQREAFIKVVEMARYLDFVPFAGNELREDDAHWQHSGVVPVQRGDDRLDGLLASFDVDLKDLVLKCTRLIGLEYILCHQTSINMLLLDVLLFTRTANDCDRNLPIFPQPDALLLSKFLSWFRFELCELIFRLR